eukprot:2001785-Prorocentrum_lima.AAC.1
MTSSLVGSEMCIRDRHGTLIGLANKISATILKCNWMFHCWINGSVTTPVSYTHLTLPTICSV